MRKSCFATTLAIVLCARAGQTHAFNDKRVVSDVAPLRSAIVFSLSDRIFRTLAMAGQQPNNHPFLVDQPRGQIREHEAFRELLRRQNVRAYDVRDLLDSAIREARRQGKLAEWLKQTFPVTANEALKRVDTIDAASVLNLRDDHFFARNAGGMLAPLFPGVPSMHWSRDFAVSTSKGIIIGNGQYYRRSVENSIARFIFQFSGELKPFPVVFDAANEGVFLDGGDVIVLDEKTLLVGVGNRTSREAAGKLAQKLGLDVIAVAMPPADKHSGLNSRLLHLDTIFNLVDEKKVLAVPFFLEKRYAESNPLKSILSGVADQIDELRKALPEGQIEKSDEVRMAVQVMPQVGWLTRHEGGSGKATALNLKLVDYIRERGYQVIYVGGEQGSLPLEKYVLERAMYELRWQGTNVVALRPGRVIAYEHNVHTNDALRRAGVEVMTFPGELLSIKNGGPHCLTMPLVRGGE